MNMGIKKLIIWITVFMIVCLATAAVILAIAGNLSIGTEEIDKIKTFEPGEIDNISIDIQSTDINIKSTDEEKITVRLYGKVSTNRKGELPALIAYRTGRELRVEIAQPRTILIGKNVWRLKLDISIPGDLIENLNIDTVSADTFINDIKVKRINYDSISGDFKGEILNSDNLKINATSGDIILKNYTGNLKINSVSGDVILEDGTSDNIEIAATSGDICIEQEEPSNINVKSISGDIEINLSENANFYIKAGSVSGDIENTFPIKIISSGRSSIEGIAGNNEKEIIVNAVSGDISIGYR
jgi:lia operon protein LiaG